MEKSITYKVEKLSYDELCDYLINHTNLHTVPPTVFANKIIENGYTIVARDSGKAMCGVSCVYYNRPQKDFGFLSFIGVRESKRGLHIGSSLLKETIALGRKLDYANLKLQVRRENERAYRMYLDYEFQLEFNDKNNDNLNLCLK